MPTKYNSCEFISHLHSVGIIMDFNTIFTSGEYVYFTTTTNKKKKKK